MTRFELHIYTLLLAITLAFSYKPVYNLTASAFTDMLRVQALVTHLVLRIQRQRLYTLSYPIFRTLIVVYIIRLHLAYVIIPIAYISTHV
jgi:hypothetical protein